MDKVCISFHGHILTRTPEGARMLHHLDARNLSELIKFNGIPSDIQIDTQLFETNVLYDGIYTLVGAEGFASCRPNGRIGNARNAQTFEEFSFVDFDLIDHILTCAETAWQDPETDAYIEKGAIKIDTGHNVDFQKFSAPLADVSQHLAAGRGTIIHEKHRYIPTDAVKPPDPVIWLKPLGNTANRALSYLIARRIARDIPNASIRNYRLPEWGLSDFAAEPENGKICKLGRFRFWIDCDGLADALRRRQIDTLVQDAYCYNVDFLPDRDECREILGNISGTQDVAGYGNDVLLCNIRQGEVLTGKYRSYIVLPPEYYRKIAESSGLNPVFFGQLQDNAYTESLYKAFPDASFVTGISAENDFEVVRKSSNVAIAVSTFSWLAAWLGHARNIYVLLGGMLHPNFQKHQSYIVTDDPAFRYVLLPQIGAISLFDRPEDFFCQQAILGQGAEIIDIPQVERILEKSQASWQDTTRLGGFDNEYYLNAYPRALAEIERNGFGSALEHYLNIGAQNGYLPFEFDTETYLLQTPSAGAALARGDYPDALSHAQDMRAAR